MKDNIVNRFLPLDQLSSMQINQYHHAISKAFPPIISESQVIKQNWPKLEAYFPQYQRFLLSTDNHIIGFMNTVPFQFNAALNDLPERGWDWMLEKGIADFENERTPNYLGGLQVIVRKEYQQMGYSKNILDHVKSLTKASDFLHLVIPIRPTKKHEFPQMPMATYLNLMDDDKIYDPWIRTHINSGAQLIKVCGESMTMKGDVKFWESMLDQKLSKSGKYQLKGALELITVDIENNTGQYVEPNIWIKYN